MLTKDEILRRTDNGLEVFRRYIGGEWRVGRNFLNPLYEDRKASCNIYFDRHNGCYQMKDFGNDDFSGDCFDIVGRITGLNCGNPKDFIGILKAINHDLHLGLDGGSDTSFSVPVSMPVAKPKRQPENTPVPAPKKVKPYSTVQQSFSARETAFWMQYGITSEILKIYRVSSLREFRSENSEGKPFSFYSTDGEPVFGYQGKRHIKIYRPNSEIRFLYGGLLPDNYCFGLEQLPAKGDTLFITGGEKDVLSLVSKRFHAICFNSETSNIAKSIIKKLLYRFKHIILLYDTDKTGLDSSAKHQQQLSKLGVKRLVLPLAGTKQEKDVSDYFRLGNSRENFIQLFIEFLDRLYSETMAILKPCEIDFSHPPLRSEAIISINEVPLGTQGNLLGITGGEGTGKSKVSVVKALKVRDGSPLDVPLVQFSWDREKSMHTYIGDKPKEEREKRKETELTGVARTIFAKQRFFTYVELCVQIQSILDVKERAAKSYIRFMRDKEIILKDPTNDSCFIIGNI